MYQCWGQPWRRRIGDFAGSPGTDSATCTRTPFASTKRCSTPSTGGKLLAIGCNLFADRGRCATQEGVGWAEMTKERLKSPRARLFVALDLPDEVREGLVAWQHEALTDQALRPIPPEALHVTLCFLAYQPERDIERIAAVMRWVDPRRVQVRFKEEPAAVPPNRPRLFAADAESEAAIELQAELSDRLRGGRLYPPRERALLPPPAAARVKASQRPAPHRPRVPPGP